MEQTQKKIQSKADIMEQLSRSLQTERNNLKEELKQLKEKFCPEEVKEEPATVETEPEAEKPATEVVAEQTIEKPAE